MTCILRFCKYGKFYDKNEDSGPAVVEIHGVAIEDIDTVEQCITARNNGIHGTITSTFAPLLGNSFHLKFYK